MSWKEIKTILFAIAVHGHNLSMLRVTSCIAPPESFAPYSYLLKHTHDLHQRYAVLAKDIGSQDFMETPEFGSLDIILCWDTGQQPLNIKEIVSERAITTSKRTSKIDSFTNYLEETLTETKASTTIVILSLDCSAIEEIENFKDYLQKNVIFMIIVDEKSKRRFKSPDDLGGITFFTRKDKINSDIGDLLERKVLKTFKEKCEHLSKWLSVKKFLDLKETEKTNSVEENRKRKTSDPELKTSRPKRLCTGSIATFDRPEGIQETSGRKSKGDTLSTSKPSVKRVSRDTIERLLAEMLALYSTSSVPAQERPNITDNNFKPISKKVQTEILNLDPTVKGIGYRFTTLVINIEERSSKECQLVKKKIKKYLRTYSIEDFTIEVTSEVKLYELRTGCAITNTITQTKSTAGCFAICQNEKCVLVANHAVATDSCTFSYCPDNGSASKILGQVIKETRTDDGFDMAALKLESGVEICAKFRTEEDEEKATLLQGKLYKYIEGQEQKDRGILQYGQRVYIWGAVSKPGKGVVTMCEYTRNKKSALIEIKDRFPGDGKQFCQPGDSGAIVCVEDRNGQFVHLLAMLMGESIDKKGVEKNADCGKKYVAVLLSSELQELEKRTEHRFEILECINQRR